MKTKNAHFCSYLSWSCRGNLLGSELLKLAGKYLSATEKLGRVGRNTLHRNQW